MNLLTLRLGSRDRIHLESPLLQRIACYIRRFRRYSLMFSRDLCSSLWLFLTTDKSVWITTYTCHSYDHPPLILLLQDTPKFSLLFREYFVPTAQQFFATWIPLQINPRAYRVSAHPPAVHVLHKSLRNTTRYSDNPQQPIALEFLVCFHYD